MQTLNLILLAIVLGTIARVVYLVTAYKREN